MHLIFKTAVDKKYIDVKDFAVETYLDLRDVSTFFYDPVDKALSFSVNDMEFSVEGEQNIKDTADALKSYGFVEAECYKREDYAFSGTWACRILEDEEIFDRSDKEYVNLRYQSFFVTKRDEKEGYVYFKRTLDAGTSTANIFRATQDEFSRACRAAGIEQTSNKPSCILKM